MNSDLIPLSDAQALVLAKLLADPASVRWIAPITRKWLARHGLIIASNGGQGRFTYDITALGREVEQLDRMYKERLRSS